MGSAQRLANGDTLLCESAFGRILEVTQEGYVCRERQPAFRDVSTGRMLYSARMYIWLVGFPAS
jgi:hypothetical protein